MKKMCCICTVEHYSAIRRGEILPFATTEMDLENIMLSEISQTEKVKNYILFHSYATYKTESSE